MYDKRRSVTYHYCIFCEVWINLAYHRYAKLGNKCVGVGRSRVFPAITAPDTDPFEVREIGEDVSPGFFRYGYQTFPKIENTPSATRTTQPYSNVTILLPGVPAYHIR
jgi:hypothetical protein